MIYALFYSAAVQLSSILAPPNLQATAQGIFGAIFSGFGSTLGTFVGGMVYDVMGPTTLFTGLMVMNAVMVVVFVGDILKSRRSPSSKASDVGSDGFLYVGSPLSDVSTMSATSSDRPFGSSQLLVRD